jgi:HAD superfamily hydrolase (TIGR01509 family)
MSTDLSALIWDVDGTLADTEHLHRAAFNEAFARAGLGWHWDANTYRRLLRVAGGRRRIAHWQDLRRAPGEAAWEPEGETVRALHAVKTEVYLDWIARGEIPLRDGVLAMLQEARAAGLRLAIATTTSPPNVDALLRRNIGPDWRDWFEAVEDGETAPNRKPDPQVYLQALARLGLPPQACVAFEDSITGLHASIAAGVPAVVTPSHYTAHDDFRGAMRVVPDLADVKLADVRGWHAAARRTDALTA